MIGYEIRQIRDVVICLFFYGQTLTDAVRNLSFKIAQSVKWAKAISDQIWRFDKPKSLFSIGI